MMSHEVPDGLDPSSHRHSVGMGRRRGQGLPVAVANKLWVAGVICEWSGADSKS